MEGMNLLESKLASLLRLWLSLLHVFYITAVFVQTTCALVYVSLGVCNKKHQ
jgi:hypothetical protein